MTFLKKLGTVVLKIVGVLTGFMPLVESITPSAATVQSVEDKLGEAFNVIVTAEQMFAASSDGANGLGSQKLKAATPFVAKLVQNTALLSGKTPKDEALFESSCTNLTAALAGILNSYGE